jgi:hypothetical protein
MKTSILRATACVLTALLSGAAARAASEMTIPEHVHEFGGYEQVIVRSDKPQKLVDLLSAADLVVEASAAVAPAFLDRSATHIFTDYPFTVTTIIQNRKEAGLLRTGHVIVVRRESGTVMIDGRAATTIENDFPPFANGESYVLFLKLSKDKVYTVVAGPLGAFTASEYVAPVAASLHGDAAPWPASPRDQFFGELRALLKFTN